MGLFNRKKEDEKRSVGTLADPVYGTLNFNNYSNYSNSKSMKLSTVYRCVNLISDSIASLPLIPYSYKTENDWKYINYDNGLYNLFNVQPNNILSSYTFKKLIITNMLLKGNCYILIDKDTSGRVLSFTLLNTDAIRPQIINNDLKYEDMITSKMYDKSQIVHILNYTDNGITGIPTIEHAARTLGISYDSEEHTSNHFKAGGSLSGVLKPLPGVSLNKDKAAQAKNAFISSLNSDLGGKSNSIVVLGEGLDYQPISISPAQSQLLESRAFNVIDICRFFNVPPSLAFADAGSVTVEQEQLRFLTNTMQPIIEKLENEFFRKIFLPSEYDMNELKFDVENLLRLDATTRASYYSQMFNMGVYTVNDLREKNNAKTPVKGGNRAYIQVNLQAVDNLISEQKNTTDNANQLDNKLKNNDNTKNE